MLWLALADMACGCRHDFMAALSAVATAACYCCNCCYGCYDLVMLLWLGVGAMAWRRYRCLAWRHCYYLASLL
jgi:hypothetical protein